MASQSGRFMSDDGRVAFATSDALVEGDTDGLIDVYEFVGGRPQLISSGTAQADLLPGNRFFPGEYTGVEAISHDGVDIFFSTYDTLAPDEDLNGQFLKFYDARTNGGFPPPPAHLPVRRRRRVPRRGKPGARHLADRDRRPARLEAAGSRQKRRKATRSTTRKRHKGSATSGAGTPEGAGSMAERTDMN